MSLPAGLGLTSDFTLGQFGGHAGRNLRIGDMLPITAYSSVETVALGAAQVPGFQRILGNLQ